MRRKTTPANGTTKKLSPVTHQVSGRVERSFTTSLGVQVWIGPMPPMMPILAEKAVRAEWEERGKALPVKPVYETDVMGEKQIHEHDETTLDTPEEKAAWAEYQRLLSELNNEIVNLTFEECVRNCMRFDIQPHWAQMYKRLRPPSDPIEQMDFYARAAVIGSKDDVETIMQIASELTGVDARLLSAVEDSFPDKVEKAHASEGAAV